MPKTYAVIGVITLYFFFIVFNLAGQLLTNFAGFIIPGYYSLEALFTSSKTDDTQWLTVSRVAAAITRGSGANKNDSSTGSCFPSSRKSWAPTVYSFGRETRLDFLNISDHIL